VQFKSLTEDQALRLRPCLQAALGEDALPSGKECRSIISNMLLSAISGSAISGRLVKIYNELLVAENIESKFTGTGSSWALTCGAFSSDTQLFSLPSGEKTSSCHFRWNL
jgi:hypothetical protein